MHPPVFWGVPHHTSSLGNGVMPALPCFHSTEGLLSLTPSQGVAGLKPLTSLIFWHFPGERFSQRLIDTFAAGWAVLLLLHLFHFINCWGVGRLFAPDFSC